MPSVRNVSEATVTHLGGSSHVVNGIHLLSEGEAPNFIRLDASSVGDIERGIKIRLRGDDVPGGDFHDARGRINWIIQYDRGDFFLEVVCYSVSSSFSFLYEGTKVERSYEKAYALPVDVLIRNFTDKFMLVYGEAPSSVEIEDFIRDIDTALRVFSEPMAIAMRDWLNEDLDLKIIYFDAFDGNRVPVPIDWNLVGNAAKAALAAVERGA